ncbi:hypothetical protein [Legionella hackeliae]|nr:hypothetical protein [Legionella hackeliae]
MIPNLIDFYSKPNSNDELPIKNQMLASLQNIYQGFLMLEQYPSKKKLLISFYFKIINEDLLPAEKAIAIGWILLILIKKHVQISKQ